MSDNSSPRWLKTLELRNFQSHEHTVLEFSPGVNVIRGKNSCGKSAVFRAVRFVAYNRPTRFADEALIRSGKSSCVVKATMSDGSWVLREKGKDVNRYIVNSPLIRNGQVELNNFGLSVPPEVTLALGFGPLTIAKSDGIELNLSAQGDGSFMLSETDPEIARWMYALTSLDDIRSAIDDLSLDQKRSAQNVKAREERVSDINRQISTFDGLDQRSVEIGEIENALNGIASRTEVKDALQRLLDDMTRLRNIAVPTKQRAEYNARVLAVLTEEELSGIEQRMNEVSELELISGKIDSIQPQQATMARRVSVNLKIAKVSFDGFDERLSELRTLSELSDQITLAEDSFSQASERVEKSRVNAVQIGEQYDALRREIFSNEEGDTICPLCGVSIDEDRIDHIMEGHPDA